MTTNCLLLTICPFVSLTQKHARTVYYGLRLANEPITSRMSVARPTAMPCSDCALDFNVFTNLGRRILVRSSCGHPGIVLQIYH